MTPSSPVAGLFTGLRRRAGHRSSLVMLVVMLNNRRHRVAAARVRPARHEVETSQGHASPRRLSPIALASNVPRRCARCPVRPIRSSSWAPDSADCPPPCTLRAPAAASPSSSAPPCPAGARDCCVTTATCSTPGRRCSRCPSSSRRRSPRSVRISSDWLTLHRLDPAYRARFADGTVDRRAGRRVGDGRRDRADLRHGRRRRLPRLRRLPAPALRAGDAALHRPQPRPPAATARAAAAAPGRRRRLSPARRRRSASSSPTSGCDGCSPSRRCTPGSRRRRRSRSTR